MLNSFSVKAKMLLLSCMMVVGIIILAALLGLGMDSLVKIGQASVLSVDTQRSMQSLRRIEKDFLARMDIKYLNQFNEEYEVLISNLNKLDNQLQAENILIDEIPNIISKLNQYHTDFNHVAVLQQEIGLTPTEGLYGNLRTSVQAVQTVLDELQNDSLLKDVLMLRRNEKDFMLRKEMKYFDTFNENFMVFQQSLQQSYVSEGFYPDSTDGFKTLANITSR
jgi:methyl-accepting chemotaxis protein